MAINNPYVPGDPYSYDLKWMVQEVKAAQAVGEQAAGSAAAAAASAEAAGDSADNAGTYASNALISSQNAEASAQSASDDAQAISNVAADIPIMKNNISTNAANIVLLDSRMDSFTNLSVGSTTGDAELIDGRIGANGVRYPNIGDAIRGQYTQLEQQILSLAKLQYSTILTKGASANTSGPLRPFFAKNGDVITASTADLSTFDNVQIRFYDIAGSFLTQYALASGYGNSRKFTLNGLASDAYLVGITTVNTTSPDDYAVFNYSNEKYLELEALRAEDASINEILKITPKENIINRFNKSAITIGYYLSTINGSLVANASFGTSEFIDVSDLSMIGGSYTFIICFYDSNKAFISGSAFNTRAADNTMSVPATAVYARISIYLTDIDKVQLGKLVSRTNYQPYGTYLLANYAGRDAIIVDVNGYGEYTSLTKALWDHVDENCKIIVLPGTYDIKAEYVALFGAAVVASLADSDTTLNGFQFGAIIRNKEIVFEPGAHVVCDWTGQTVDGTHRFCAFRVDYNAKIVGLDLLATNTFYAIHDDYGISIPYTNEYENCRIEGVSLYNVNCIGGGCRKYSRHILKNCYFNNNMPASTVVRYHNSSKPNAEPEIYVSNCYFNTYFTPRWYGNQTTKMRVYVNNCEAQRIYKDQESASFTTDNVELIKWCNTETNPL